MTLSTQEGVLAILSAMDQWICCHLEASDECGWRMEKTAAPTKRSCVCPLLKETSSRRTNRKSIGMTFGAIEMLTSALQQHIQVYILK
jgi:hypothetical protein